VSLSKLSALLVGAPLVSALTFVVCCGVVVLCTSCQVCCVLQRCRIVHKLLRVEHGVALSCSVKVVKCVACCSVIMCVQVVTCVTWCSVVVLCTSCHLCCMVQRYHVCTSCHLCCMVQNNVELVYKFSPVLMQHLPKETVDLWTGRRLNIEPKKLIPALVQYSGHRTGTGVGASLLF
jgi:hypothetical protein